MDEPKVLISKKSIRTMGKDMVRVKRDELDVEEKGKDDQKALFKEVEKRKQEEERLISLQEQGKKIVQEARQKRESVDVKALADKQEEMKKQQEAKRTAALQESRKKAEQEDEKREQEESKMVETKRIPEKPAAMPKAVAERTENEKEEISQKDMKKEELLEKRKAIGQEKTKIQEELKSLDPDKKPLDIKKKAILEEIRTVELSFQETKIKEDEIEQKLSVIEKREAQAKNPQQRRSLEKKRWKLEKKREEIEKKRWPEDEKLEQLEARLKSIERESKGMEAKEQELLSKQKEINKKEQDNNLKIERIDLEETLKDMAESKVVFEGKVNILFKNNEEAKNNLNVILAEEKKVEQEKAETENKERAAESNSQRRELEKARWQIEERRRQTESKRWKLEEERAKISQDLKDSQNRLKAVLDKKESISKRIEEIDLLLQGKTPIVPPKPFIQSTEQPKREEPKEDLKRGEPKEKPEKEEPKKEPKKEEPLKEKTKEEILKEVEEERIVRIEEARKRIDTLKKAALERKERQEQMKKAVMPSNARQKLEPVHEDPDPGKEERRAEIMSRLRTPVSIYKKISKSDDRKQTGVPTSEEIIRVVPKKPSFKEKLWVRALIVAATLVVLAGILTFWYWYFRIRTSVPAYPPGYEREREGISIPTALFNVTDTTIITISDKKDLSESIKKTLESFQRVDRFKRIIIKKEGEIVGVKELFELLEVNITENFYDNILDEPTMFIYSQGQGNRFGFVVKTSTSAKDLNIVLKAAEPTAETDFEPLFVLMGKKGKAVAPYFKNAVDMEDYTGLDFRFKTLDQNDLAITYAATDYYFAFSSSWESMESLLMELQNFLENKVLTNDLKQGDQGKQVSLLQGWLAKDLSIDSPGFISGIYNQETKDYVILFQEKYASDILIPQGQTKGTGIVDLATRRKLNNLYSDF